MTTAVDFGHIPERTIGRRLRDAREDTGMSQSEFAEATGLSRRTISRCEQAVDLSEIKRPTLLSWAFATNVPLEWLRTGIVPSSGDDGNGLHRRYAPDDRLGRIVPFRLAA
jgi:transcriptional regulator with XRE-family HTH domain